MSTNDIGQKVKDLRTQKNLTLKEVSEATGISIGFLSQFERGMSTIAIDSLSKIAKTLEVDLGTFFTIKKGTHHSFDLIRGYEREVANVSEKFIQYNLVEDVTDTALLPRVFQVLPILDGEKEMPMYSHEGNEFIYVLEGILTLQIEEKVMQLYPEDSVYIDSKYLHNWKNETSKMVKILTVNTPNPYRE